MSVTTDKRGNYIGMEYLDPKRVMLTFEIPLSEVISEYHDLLKSVTRGYASMDYEVIGYRESDLVKMDILLNQEPELGGAKDSIQSPIKTITEKATAWSYAGRRYNSKTTFYFLPNGLIKAGPNISDWDDLPKLTRLIIGYRGPYPVSQSRSAYQIAGTHFKDQTTVYFIPPDTLLAGNEIPDFNKLRSGTLVFLPH